MLVVGYPGHADLPAARLVARGRPVVFNPLVSLYDTLVDDRGRFAPGSPAARVLRAADRWALRAAGPRGRRHGCERGLPRASWPGCLRSGSPPASSAPRSACFGRALRSVSPRTVLFVGKLIPLHGLETILAAARLVPRAQPSASSGTDSCGRCSPTRRANVEHARWVPYEALPAELRRAGCALGVFGTSGKAARVIPNKAFQALACGDAPDHGGHAGGPRAAGGRSERAARPARRRRRRSPDALRRLSTDPGLRARIAAGGLAAYREHASEQVLGTRWRALLERLAVTPRRLLWAAMAAYGAGFTALSALRHRAFETGRFDLGNMVQAVWSTAHGRPLEMTSLRGEQVSRLGSHVDPLLAALRARSGGCGRGRSCSSPCRQRPWRSARCPCSGWRASTSLRSGPRSASRSPTSCIRRCSGRRSASSTR